MGLARAGPNNNVVMDSLEDRVFVDVLSNLSKNVALDPSPFANYLLKENLISDNIWKQVLQAGQSQDSKQLATDTMMIALKSQISADCNAIHKLITVLRKAPHLACFAKQIENKLAGMFGFNYDILSARIY